MSLSVSVIIPTHNRPQELFRAVESVVFQTILPHEIIIVNDGDKFDEFKKIKHLSGIVKFHHNTEKMGGNYSRNKGAEIASGSILMFLDDDDRWEKRKIEAQLDYFKNDESIGLVYSGRKVVLDTAIDKVIYKIEAKESGYILDKILRGNVIGTTSSVAVKKDIFVKVGGFDESLKAMQDYDLWIRICKVTNVQADKHFSVLYQINNTKKKKQISNSGFSQKEATEIILNKYKEDFISNKVSLSKRRGDLYFYVAKSFRSQSLRNALPWIAKSFYLSPSLKTLFLIISSKKP